MWSNIGQVRTCDNRQTHSVKPSVGSRRGVLVSWLYIWDVPPQVAMGIGDLGLAYQVRVSRRTALPALVLIWVAVWLAGVQDRRVRERAPCGVVQQPRGARAAQGVFNYMCAAAAAPLMVPSRAVAAAVQGNIEQARSNFQSARTIADYMFEPFFNGGLPPAPARVRASVA